MAASNEALKYVPPSPVESGPTSKPYTRTSSPIERVLKNSLFITLLGGGIAWYGLDNIHQLGNQQKKERESAAALASSVYLLSAQTPRVSLTPRQETERGLQLAGDTVAIIGGTGTLAFGVFNMLIIKRKYHSAET